MDEVLYPGEVGIAHRRHTELPAHVLSQTLPAPIFHVERWIRQDVIGLQVRVQVPMKTVGMFRAQVALNAPDRQVHLR